MLTPVMTTFVGIGLLVVVTRFRRGDLLSPFSTSLILLIAIFGVRPIFMLVNESYFFYGLEVSDGVNHASVIGLVGILGLGTGYLLAHLPAGAQAPVAARSGLQAHRGGGMTIAAVTSLLVLVVWFAVTALLGGSVEFVAETFDGRTADVEAALTGVPAIVFGLPVVAGLLVALQRIRTERVRPLSLIENVQYWSVIALSVVPPAALGNRRFLIPTVLAGLIGACTRTWLKRVTARMVLGVLVATCALAIVPFIRSAGSRTRSTSFLGAMSDRLGAEGIGGVMEDFFLSYDTEMFSYVAYVAPRLGETIPYGYGRGTLVEMVGAAAPQAVLPFQTWSNSLLDRIFGGGCGDVNCPVPSVFGTLYFDLAFPGLIFATVAIGASLTRYGLWIHRASGWRLTAVLLLGSFAPLMARGNAISQLWIAVQVFAGLQAAIVLTQLIAWIARPSRDAQLVARDEDGVRLAPDKVSDAAASTPQSI